jgi:hypothetical protein
MVTLAIAELLVMALEIVKLTPLIDVAKVVIGASFMSRVVQVGFVIARLYCAGNMIVICDYAGTSWEA